MAEAKTQKNRRFEIDDGINRDDEFKRFEEEQAQVAVRKQEAEVKVKQERKEKATKVSDKQFQNRDTVLLWGPTLITAPLVPGFLALGTIAAGTAVVHWHFLDFADNSPCLEVQAYVIGQVVVSYLFLATYMALLIGPQCCARACGTTTLLFIYWAIYAAVFLGLNMWGIYAVYSLDVCVVDYATLTKTDDTVSEMRSGVGAEADSVPH